MPNRRLNAQWCRDHWRPYRKVVDGVRPNGIVGFTLMMQAFIDSPMVQELTDRSAAALNRNMAESDKPVCCRLGDEVMQRILDEAKKAGVPDQEQP